MALRHLRRLALESGHRQAGDHHRLAPQGLPSLRAWKIRHGQPRCPPVSEETREPIRRISRQNRLWGAPRIHGELLKLGIDIGETSVGKYMVRHRKPPSQTGRTFLQNNVKTMVSIDLFTVPTIRFPVLYLFLVLAHDRRRILHFGVTAYPAAEWTAQQSREAFPWLSANVERVIGTIRQDCLDHVIVFNEASLYRHVKSFTAYHPESRTHLSLAKDTPEPRPLHSPDLGPVIVIRQVGGLHHRYERRAA